MKSRLWERTLDWFGFGGSDRERGHAHNGAHGSHGHTHGTIDPTIASTDRGIWAIKWSFVVLAITATLQLIVVFTSGSIALLADTIHNFGDATTAIPLWIAFALALRMPTQRFSYGYGRVEDIAGVLIVLIILISAIVAGYEAINRLVHPQAITRLAWVAIAGIVGFIGNEVVAVFRIRVGREINSAALIADGYHARTDGLTSLAVVVGAVGVWLGFPLADPIIGLLITIAILGIVWQSARAVFTRMLDGVEPGILSEIRHATEHVPGIDRVIDVRARWLGHRLHADVAIAVDDGMLLAAANGLAASLQEELFAHLPALATANVRFAPSGDLTEQANGDPRHRHAPMPFHVRGELADGVLEIVDTPEGERIRLRVSRHAEGLNATVAIDRPDGRIETLALAPAPNDHHRLESAVAPTEPHQFDARLQLTAGERREELQLRLMEPEGHHS